ncbi:amidophosphoribosyltransferase [Rubritalea squalenifaciens DSM 18772]|uniref:Amidophosphoribosyltransferase n=1 Tax=Rubritalea squalenifaciens DSM 18772 TaxID=1123071 RepID=A0A1M6IGA0_9BACT|nr:amidophosphoribosyltransferase [Rubritalea squalenifaciens]SHJ33468.1 amidophosphoribosyltransferase [Rubritalea squalenifaciens DSM 18772]
MSDFLKHECGIALIRLRKPISYYIEKYGTPLWGLNKLFLLMEKQHNRGQDGIGIGCCKLGMPLGQPYIFRRRDARKDSLATVFNKEIKTFNKLARKQMLDPSSAGSVKNVFDFGGEVLMGHLRYGTSGRFDEGSCHPYLRRSNWPTRTLLVQGNFNMTNAGALNQKLIERGQHPVFGTDTQTVLEELGFHLDEAHTDLYRELRDKGVDGQEIPAMISENLDLLQIISESAKSWDGGYAICGAVGNGDTFVMRDPRGIRPCHYYIDDEVIAFASERVPLMTVFEANKEQVKEMEPGNVTIIGHNGEIRTERFHPEVQKAPCSFERIYFSRGNDPSIYRERKAMGAALVDQVVDAMNNDFDKAVFSFIPNTAETAYYGLMDGLRMYRRQQVRAELVEAIENGTLDVEMLDKVILRNWPKSEKVAHKDIKMRTFISQEKGRAQLVSHVYDITYDLVKPVDTLVMLDDSIVRGTTLKQSILKILSRTNPKKIVVCSTAPQIRYPDCYGIDMSELGKFIAFQAAVALHEREGNNELLKEIYEACKEELRKPAEERVNQVKRVYECFTDDQISAEVSRMVYPEDVDWDGEVQIIFQTIDNLHASIKGPCGDWYFTGDFPTPGGMATVNAAYINWFEGKSGRSYDLPLV